MGIEAQAADPETLLKLARFQILDSRNGDEESKDKLLGIMADEIERLDREKDEYALLAAQRNVRIALIAEERDKVRDLLQALLDEQNGPPLETRKEQWQRAYDQARAALTRSAEPK